MSQDTPQTTDIPCGEPTAADFDWVRRQAITAGHWIKIGNLRIAVVPGGKEIAIERDGEGGWFSAQEFHDMVQEFVSERL